MEDSDGQPLRGAACLYHFLAQESIVTREMQAGKEVIGERQQPIARFSERELMPEDPSAPGVREILDAWGTPLHYDNTEDGRFEPQRGDVHVEPLEDGEHPVDPRAGTVEVDGAKVVTVPGIQGRGYDLWSHGSQGHEMDEAPSLPVASWNLR